MAASMVDTTCSVSDGEVVVCPNKNVCYLPDAEQLSSGDVKTDNILLSNCCCRPPVISRVSIVHIACYGCLNMFKKAAQLRA